MIRFAKMHGAGNDFVVIDCINQQVAMTDGLARAIAHRQFGIGCDQVLLVERAPDESVDFRYRIFNADGSEVEQCGNGARCFARFVTAQGLTTKREIRVITAAGVIVPRLEADGSVTVNMGPPEFALARVPFQSAGLTPIKEPSERWPIELNNRAVPMTVLSMGNPHAVQIVANVDAASVAIDGPLIEAHARFPKRVNAGFMQVVSPHQIRLRVFERGAGETLACGTGACAAAVSGIALGVLESPVTVQTRGGDLTIRWPGGDNPVFMTGPAVMVFEAEFDPTALTTR